MFEESIFGFSIGIKFSDRQSRISSSENRFFEYKGGFLPPFKNGWLMFSVLFLLWGNFKLKTWLMSEIVRMTVLYVSCLVQGTLMRT